MPAQMIDCIVLVLRYHVFAVVPVPSINPTWICAYLLKVE